MSQLRWKFVYLPSAIDTLVTGMGMSTKPNFFVQSLPAEHPQISSETAGQKCSVFVINIRSIYAFKLYKLCMIKVMYGVYVVEQVGNTPFNRAMLMNVGAAEAVKQQVFNFLSFAPSYYWESIL